jgi:hypothetical protein
MVNIVAKQLYKNIIYIAIIVIVAVIAVNAAFLLNKDDGIPAIMADNAMLIATVYDEEGMDINSAFLFSSDYKVTAVGLRQNLKVKPDLELSFHQGASAKEILIAPAEPLEEGTLYRFSLTLADGAELNWAFQTKGEYTLDISAAKEPKIPVAPGIIYPEGDAGIFSQEIITAPEQAVAAAIEALEKDNVAKNAPILVMVSSKARSGLVHKLWQAALPADESLPAQLSAIVARQLLIEYGDDMFRLLIESIEEDFSAYQATDGGLSFFPHGESDLALSAQCAALLVASIDREDLKNYFAKYLNGYYPREQQILALSGLAILGEPVLNQLKQHLLPLDDLTENELFTILWGMYSCGDKQEVKSLLAYAVRRELFIGDPDPEHIHAVALAALLAAACGYDKTYTNCAVYLDKYQLPAQNLAPEAVLAAERLLPALNMIPDSGFFINKGELQNIKLEGKNDYLLQIEAAELKTLALKNISGEVVFNVFYIL